MPEEGGLPHPDWSKFFRLRHYRKGRGLDTIAQMRLLAFRVDGRRLWCQDVIAGWRVVCRAAREIAGLGLADEANSFKPLCGCGRT